MLDLQEIQNLNDGDKDRYLKMERLFEQPGWKLLTEWAELNEKAQKERAAFAQSWEENRISIGKTLVYQTVANFPSIIEAEYRDLAKKEEFDESPDNPDME